MDEQQIEQSTKSDLADEESCVSQSQQQPPPENNDLPIEQRLASKEWNLRVTAFQELETLFKAGTDGEAFKDYAAKWSTLLLDGNLACLDKALDALIAYLDKASPSLVSQHQNDLLKVIIEKCMSHSKPEIKTKALKSVKLMFEVSENFEAETLDIIEDQCKSLKLPIKIMTICLLANLIAAFGVKRFPIERYQTYIEAMANNSSSPAKTEALNCYKAIYLWVGDDIDFTLGSLKPPQKEFVKKQLPQHKETTKNFKRLTRSEQAELSNLKSVEEVKEVVQDQDDSAPLLLLDTFTSEWVEATLALKVWEQKRDKMQDLVFSLEANPRLAEGNYTDLVSLCQKFVSDSHILVCQLAVKSIGFLARGLLALFTEHIKNLFPLLVKKQTEKRLLDDLHTTFSHFAQCVTLTELTQFIVAGLKDKIPVIQRQTAIWLGQQLHTTYVDVIEACEPEMLPVLVGMIQIQDKETREIGMKALGVFLARLAPGSKDVLDQYTANVPQVKKTKIEEAFYSVKPSDFDKSFKVKAEQVALKAPARGNANRQASDELTNNEIEEKLDVESNNNNQIMEDEPLNANAGSEPAQTTDQQPMEEQPVGKSSNNNQMMDEYPPGGGPPPAVSSAADELPVGKSNNNNQMMDEFPPGFVPPSEQQIADTAKTPVQAKKKPMLSSQKKVVEVKEDEEEKPSASMDELPVGKSINKDQMEELPVGKSSNNNKMLDEYPPGFVPPSENELMNDPAPVKAKKKPPMLNSQKKVTEQVPAADELPVGKSNNNNQMMDEYPPGGGPPPTSSGAGDEIPIGKSVNKNQMMDEYPPGFVPPKSSGAGDEIPIGKSVNKNQMMDEFPPGFVPGSDSLDTNMDASKVVKKRPMLKSQGAKKVAPVKPSDEPAKGMEVDELPVGKSTKKNQMTDEHPPDWHQPASRENAGDEIPIGKSVNTNQMMSEYPPGFVPPTGAGDEIPIGKSVQNTMEAEFATDANANQEPVFKVKKNPVIPEPRTAGKAGGKGGDDEGGEMTKEDAIAIVQGFYHEENVKYFDGTKWQDKVKGFQAIQGEIEANKPDSVTIWATALFLKTKMKDWKESNMNMIKESINVFLKIVECCDRIPKKALSIYGSFLCEKIGEAKYGPPITQLLTSLADFITSKYVAQQVTKHMMTSKNPKNLQEACKWITELLDEWGANNMPVKECIDYANVCASSTSGPVRTQSMQLFAVLYKHLGETVKPYLSEVKESTRKLIDEEFKKVTPLKKGEFRSKKELKGEAKEEMAVAGPVASFMDGLPREDISKHLTAKLLSGYKEKEWIKRKAVSDTVVEVLKDAKMRIKPDGIQDLMEALKAQMKESNKAVLKANLQLMGVLAEALGAGIKPYVRKCFVPLIFNLSDKQSLVRKDTVEAMNKWGEAIGNEIVITWACVQLETDNPEIREESLLWIIANKDSIKGADHSVMVKPLVQCLVDKAAKIRGYSEQVIVEVMQSIGFEPFMLQCKDLKTAVQQSVKPILEKAKAKAGVAAASAGAAPADEAEDPREESKTNGSAPNLAKRPPTAATAQSKQPSGPTLKQKPIVPTLKPTLKPKEDAPSVRTNDQLNNKSPQPAESRPLTTRGPAAISLPIGDSDDMLIVNAGNKQRRAEIDAKSKWLHEEMKPEQTDKVKHICEQLFGYEFMQKMFSTDFKKHIEVLKSFNELIQQQPQNLKDTLDVIIKWSCIKLAESQNTTFAGQLFDFFGGLFEFLCEEDYVLSDAEAFVLVPMLCDKLGLNNAILKDKVRKLTRSLFKIFDSKKCCQLMFKFGVGAKNLKSVAESISELCIYITESGLDNITEKDLQQVSKLVDSGDKGVRESSLAFIGEVYKNLDDGIWQILGNVNIKVKGLLEGRFKQVKKGTNGGANNMNRSINSTVSPIETQRRSIVPQKQADTMGHSMNKSLNKSLVSKEISATPRRGVMPTLSGANKQSSASNSLSKSIKKDNPMNSSINSNNGGLSKLAQSQSNIQRPQAAQVAQTQRTSLKFTSSSQERVNQAQAQQKAVQQPSFVQEFNQEDKRYTLQNKAVMETSKMVFHDDDDDLRQQINIIDQFQPPKEQMDPKLKEQIDFIMKHVQSLKYGDLSKRVDSLVALNDIMLRIQQYNSAIVRCSNELCSAFTHVMVDVFERSLNDIPLRFAKYFVTIVNRVCQSPEVMMAANEKETYELTEQLLMRLLTEQLDKLGENKEGEVILKTLNAAMLRLLENCQPTLIYCALYNLLRKYKDYTVLPKLPGLVIKCLLKLAKIIEKQTSFLEIDKILLVIHEYLLVINHDEKSQNDEMGIRITKTVINELVKIKGETIWESYKLVERHIKADNHIQRWISLILSQPSKNLNDTAPSFGNQGESSFGAQQPVVQQPPVVQQQPAGRIDGREIKQIIDELRSTDLFEGAIAKLHSYLQRHPNESLNTYLKDLSQHFGNFIRSHLEQYQNGLVETGATIEPQESNPPTNNQFSASCNFGDRKMSPFGQNRQNSGLPPSRLQQQPQIQQQNVRPSPFNQSGSTGRAPTTSVDHQQQSSEQRMSSYQNKLDSMNSMKERLQKSGSSNNLVVQETGNQPPANVQEVTTPSKLPPTSVQRGYSGSLIGSAHKAKPDGEKSTFSQMNSSLSQKWKQISTKPAVGEQVQAPVTQTAQDQSSSGTSMSELNQLRQQNAERPSFIGGGAPAGGQATPSDLQQRLAQMKAKLQQIKK